jgi:GTP diphosphokinase / guanosine-3',5'-bis(diphosphate) 3'-diphosphatase
VPEGSDRSYRGAPQPPSFAQDGLPRRAWELACEAHEGQLRKGDGAPYMVHPVAVADLVVVHGGDEAMVAAALLHDVLEDTEFPAADLRRELGPEVAGLVEALTDDREITVYEERKAGLRRQVERAGERAILIYGCDKLANLRSLRELVEREGAGVEERFNAPTAVRLAIWAADLELTERRLGPTPLVIALGAELERVRRLHGVGRAII